MKIELLLLRRKTYFLGSRSINSRLLNVSLPGLFLHYLDMLYWLLFLVNVLFLLTVLNTENSSQSLFSYLLMNHNI